MTTGPEAGYYADPSILGYIRYWDGTQWVPGTSRPAPEQQSPEKQSTAAPPVEDPYATQTISTMVVPSAFGTRGGYGNPGWNGSAGVSGYDPSPYAAVPGLDGQPEAGDGDQPEVRVVELASAGSRILARIIDLAIAAVASSPATATLLLIAHRHDHAYVQQLRIQAKTTYRTLGMDATGIGLWVAALVVLLFAAMCLDAFRLSRSGQTTGRRLVGVQVVTADTASGVGVGTAFARSLLFWGLAILPVIDVLALGGVLWGRPYRQGLHEKLTRTISIKA